MKLDFLPHLPLRTWFGLWLVAAMACVVNFVGGRLLDLFTYSEDVGTACIVAFVLLAVTPLDLTRQGIPRPPAYDPNLSQGQNARRLLTYIEAHPEWEPPSPEMIASLRELAERDERDS